jgi:tyrosyl-tRNA synthetase
LDIFDGVPQSSLSNAEIQNGVPIIEFLVAKSGVFPSNGEAKRMLQGGGVSINKTKIDHGHQVGSDDLLAGKYILVQKGKKNYHLVIVE